MGIADYYANGQWNAYCDFCGKKQKSSAMVKTWENRYVCRSHKEVRNPQDFLRAVPERQQLPWTNPKPPDIFVQPVLYCTPNGVTAVPDFAVPGCAIPNYTAPGFSPDSGPICTPLNILEPTTQPPSPFVTWACGSVTVDSDYTILGTLGVA